MTVFLLLPLESSLCLFFCYVNYDMFDMDLFEYLFFLDSVSYTWISVFFFRFGKFSVIISSNTFQPFSLSTSSGTPLYLG